jgi:hypothetical protein
MGREASFRSGHARVYDPKGDATYVGEVSLAGRTTNIRGHRLLAGDELGESVDMTFVGATVVVSWLHDDRS